MRKILLAAAVCGLAFEGIAQAYFQRLKSFGFPESSGPSGPQAGLIVASNGMLYGTTDVGGAHYAGTVYKLNRDGSGLRVLHSFSKTGGDGWSPYAGLVQGKDGALYGTTSRGGNSDRGTVFKLQPDGTGYALLRSFSANDGAGPYGELVEGSDGILYGTTVWGGGSANAGTVFKLKKDGIGFTVVRTFTGTAGDGRNPYGSLLEASDGVLYGTTYSGGASNKGTVFKLKKDGSGYAVLHSFSNSSGDGQNPYAGVMEGQDGALYGMTPTGGAGSRGIIFKLQKDGSRYTVLRTFLGVTANDADTPYGRLLKGTDGALYGTTYWGGTNYNNLGTVFKVKSDGSGYTLVRSFAGGNVGDGQNPHAGLAQGSDGTLYGTTYSGGSYFAGTVFQVNKNGSGYTLLQSFLAAGGDGQNPPDLIEGRDGVLYGVAQNGGSNNLGAVFRLNKDGSGYSLLRSFLAPPGEGAWPYAGLVEGSDGVLYGTTKYGGGYGVVFKLNKDGSSYGVLHTFSYAAGEAWNPQASLVEGSDGRLYGTTVYGGKNNAGAVFTLGKDGSGYAVIRSFTGTGGDGQNPQSSLVEASDQVLYGTTYSGGTAGQGSVFSLNKDGSGYKVLWSFLGGSDGACPMAGLIEGSDGVLYGTTSSGGSGAFGTVFRLTKDGSSCTVLRSFAGTVNDGLSPRAGLVEGPDGALYGTTDFSVFKLNKDGSGYIVLRNFVGAPDAGQNLQARLLKGSDGALYGTACRGGDMGLGTVFRLFSSVPAPVVLPLFRDNVGLPIITWRAIPGLTYQLQWTADLNGANWKTLTPNVTAITNAASKADNSGSISPRYYRVQWIP